MFQLIGKRTVIYGGPETTFRLKKDALERTSQMTVEGAHFWQPQQCAGTTEKYVSALGFVVHGGYHLLSSAFICVHLLSSAFICFHTFQHSEPKLE